MKTIIVINYTKLCLSELSGNKIKNFVEEAYNNNEKTLFDFYGITKFATSFFNYVFGTYILKYGIEKYNSLIEVTNLTELGNELYSKSVENAIKQSKMNSDEKVRVENFFKDLEE
ncbi:uncharacterized protein DUF4325 [Oceanotoga teriensis]|uniref:Uncharacterized protein DUF4325 n=1 Tax=Oceanotoga teriensis TaxID=515440 RepID=A0AA45C5E9_9BACT|nr:STAS-like domain-containing protein [Oceanotoga teriensis]PWJ88988.1 uncharacterized protein DUF4325 [Oceanotoga teriensis]